MRYGLVELPQNLNLGCNDDHRPGYWNVDMFPPADECVDLSKDWPWPPSSFKRIYAHDIFEHLPSKINSMNESWRVLEPGGILDIHIPSVAGYGAFQDPTHCSFWTPNDKFYYCEEFPEHARFGRHYGIKCNFKIIEWKHVNYIRDDPKAWKIMALLGAIK